MDLSVLSHKLAQNCPKPMGSTRFFSVFIPLVAHEGEWSLLFEVRSSAMRRQPSEVCFPGGGFELGESPSQCAVRELAEELGVHSPTILGELDFMCHRSGGVIYPVVGTFPSDTPLVLNPDEVSEIFYVPLSVLKSQHEICTLGVEVTPKFPLEQVGITENYPWGVKDESFPVYRHQGHVIWGITANITQYLLQFL